MPGPGLIPPNPLSSHPIAIAMEIAVGNSVIFSAIFCVAVLFPTCFRVFLISLIENYSLCFQLKLSSIRAMIVNLGRSISPPSLGYYGFMGYRICIFMGTVVLSTSLTKQMCLLGRGWVVKGASASLSLDK